MPDIKKEAGVAVSFVILCLQNSMKPHIERSAFHS